MSAAEDLQREHEALLEFVYLCPVGLAQLDGTGQIEMMNSTGAQLLTQLDPTGCFENLYALLEPFAPELNGMVRGLEADQGTVCEAHRIEVGRRSPGAPFPLVLSLTLIRLHPTRTMAVLADVSRSVAQERAMRQAEERFRAILDGIRDYAIFGISLEGQIENWNRSAERLYGFGAQDIVGHPFRTLFCRDAEPNARADALMRTARDAGWGEDEGWWTRKASTRFWGSSVLSVVETEDGQVSGFTCITRDLSRRKRNEDETKRLAEVDFLTGLYNRRAFTEAAERELQRFFHNGEPFSLILFDADRFKSINDTYGHSAGDDILKTFARICRDAVREVDLVARFGGEEFVILLPHTDAVGTRGVAERIRLLVEACRVPRPGGDMRFTVSAGISTVRPGTTLAQMLELADRALYDAKARGRNRTVVAQQP